MLRLNIEEKYQHKLNSMCDYMKCNRKELVEFLIIEGYKSIDAEKKSVQKIEAPEFGYVSFVTEGE
ncbi:MAG: hypothetical protein JXQ67_05165 [Campylobacterales bacterium]|nr:hypothetical protein [Campylobacterales bacterium]